MLGVAGTCRYFLFTVFVLMIPVISKAAAGEVRFSVSNPAPLPVATVARVSLPVPAGLIPGKPPTDLMLDGEAVPFGEVEVEYYNEDGEAEVPSELMITQTIKADEQGIFTYATPTDGWWGFAALNTAEEPMMYEGEEKAHELGAVIWVRFEEWDD